MYLVFVSALYVCLLLCVVHACLCVHAQGVGTCVVCCMYVVCVWLMLGSVPTLFFEIVSPLTLELTS